MKRLCLAAVLLLSGCIGTKSYPEREVTFDVKDASGAAIPEWWVLSWRWETRTHFGIVWWGHGLNGWPSSSSYEEVKLVRMTPGANRMEWPGSYYTWMWYLLLLPPGGQWQGWANFVVVAPGQAGTWVVESGSEYPWHLREAESGWHVSARNFADDEVKPEDEFKDAERTLEEVARILAHIEISSIDAEDLGEFLRIVLENSTSPTDSTARQEVQGVLDNLK